MADPKQRTPAQTEKRRRKNSKRKQARRLCAQGRALPPVVGLAKSEYIRLTGGTAGEYDAYCAAFIVGAKKSRRRWEFPLEPLAGVVISGKSEKRSASNRLSK